MNAAYNKLLTAIGSEIITDERIKEKIEEYAKSGIEIDSESAREEIVAEYIGEALAKSDRKTLHKIIGDKRNVAEVLLDMVDKLIDLFRNDKELRKGYEKAREAIVEAINSIDKERAARHEEGRTESTKTTENVKYALSGINEEGIEIYETSKEIKELPIKEKKRRFLNLMKEEYKGRTAKFIAGGKTYYAIFDKADLQKNVYGDRLSSHKGWEAKINTGADGDIFELVENSTYSGSSKESGKDIDAHKGIIDWDYFVKKVEIDGVLYDLIANVRKNSDSQYVYSIQLNENKRRQTVQQKVNKTFVNQARSASNDDSVSQKSETVNTKYTQKGKKL